ncbi:YqgE/AlgH family protein [Algivirga pacifica]|uniref:YqgE/AlgH family protein n=1 Tax=Algivirga pacifica TaxID=1162670 RepID=A0ABP9DNW3_9BACT
MEFNLSFSQNTALKRGDLLLAEPFLGDPNFARSVILVCEHEEEKGSFGLILNRPSNLKINEVTDQLSVEQTLYVGGPVEHNTLHFLHRFGELEGAIPLKNGVFWGGNFEQIKEYALMGKLQEDNCRFFMGYSGWGGMQLKEELTRHSWVITHANLSSIFTISSEQLWRKVLQAMGGKYKVMSNYPVEPRMN